MSENNKNNWRRLKLNPCRCGCGEMVAKVAKHGHGRRRPVSDRLAEKTTLVGSCVIWTGAIGTGGYGRIGIGSGTRQAHRVAYGLAVRELPIHVHLDHLCHNEAKARGECAGGKACLHRRCINPDHLEPVSQRENNRRIALSNRARREMTLESP